MVGFSSTSETKSIRVAFPRDRTRSTCAFAPAAFAPTALRRVCLVCIQEICSQVHIGRSSSRARRDSSTHRARLVRTRQPRSPDSNSYLYRPQKSDGHRWPGMRPPIPANSSWASQMQGKRPLLNHAPPVQIDS